MHKISIFKRQEFQNAEADLYEQMETAHEGTSKRERRKDVMIAEEYWYY